MRNDNASSAASAHCNLEWFAYSLVQLVNETPPDDRKRIKRLILDATKDLRKIRRSYPPARPQIHGWRAYIRWP